MKRWIAGASVVLLLMVSAVLWLRARPPGAALRLDAPAAAATQAGAADDATALVAPRSDVTPADREARRFIRVDKDRNGDITRDEYLATRRKAFAKLDADGDGRLDFDEYAVKAIAKFDSADVDHDRQLVAAEFATTALKRNPRTRAVCPPVVAGRSGEDDEG